MAWLETGAVTERRRFVLEHETGLFTVSELCERFGISRPTGYKWLSRYMEGGLEALEDGSRRPHSCPHRTSPEVEGALVQLRQQHADWGPVTLLDRLKKLKPGLRLPAASTASDILHRHGLTVPRKRRAPRRYAGRPYVEMASPNDVWTADYKGQFLTRDRRYCYPLTIADGHSRFLIGCRAQLSTAYAGARAGFVAAFREYGLPKQILTDNGGPFASRAIHGLSRLSVWWIKLGIHPIRIQPGHPEQNGRHERMHRTLKAQTTRPPAANVRAQQHSFDRFRRCYNEERPHRALQGEPPGQIYRASARRYPARIPEMTYPGHYKVMQVCNQGVIHWHDRFIWITTVLQGERIGMECIDDGLWSIYFGPILLGRIDERDHRFVAI